MRCIGITGGGLVAWMAAVFLARRLEALGPVMTIDGEGGDAMPGLAGPGLHAFHAAIGLDTATFVRETDAVPYLGAPQDGWFLPCGGFGADLDGIPFHHHWLRLLTLGGSPDLGRFSLEATAAREGRFGGALGRPLTYGFRFDAEKYCTLLQGLATEAGVKRGGGGTVDLTVDCGRRETRPDAWVGRTVALEPAAGGTLLPALDQTIHALERLVALWPRPEIAPVAVARFNADVADARREAHDFDLAYQCLSGRVSAMPDRVSARIGLFRATGEIESAPGPVRSSDWLALFTGLNVRPSAVHPAAELVPEDDLKRRLARVRTHIQDTVNALPLFAG